MEPVSLSVSVIALVGLFDNALNCFKHVKVAKSFGTDYQTYVLRLQNLRLRLSRWGEAVGLGKPSTAVSQPRTSSLSASEVKQAEVLVGHIIQLFSDTEELAEKYAGKQSDLVAIEDDSNGLGDASKLCQKMRNICIRRQRESSAATKAKWSLFSKDKFIEHTIAHRRSCQPVSCRDQGHHGAELVRPRSKGAARRVGFTHAADARAHARYSLG
jgi:hypothetical protein